MDNTNQITLAKMLEVLRKFLLWIILAAVIVGSLAAIGAQLLVKDSYSCRMECLISDMSGKSSTELSNMTKYVNYAIKRLHTTDAIEKVVRNAGITLEDGTYAVSLMKNSTSISPNAEDSGFVVTVTTTKPEVSFSMIRSFRDLLPDLIEEFGLMDFDVIESTESAPTSASNRNRALRYGLIGAVGGAALLYVILLIYSLIDVTIRNESDLKKYVNYPVLGLIPLYSGEVENGEKVMNKNQPKQEKRQ